MAALQRRVMEQGSSASKQAEVEFRIGRRSGCRMPVTEPSLSVTRTNLWLGMLRWAMPFRALSSEVKGSNSSFSYRKMVRELDAVVT